MRASIDFMAQSQSISHHLFHALVSLIPAAGVEHQFLIVYRADGADANVIPNRTAIIHVKDVIC